MALSPGQSALAGSTLCRTCGPIAMAKTGRNIKPYTPSQRMIFSSLGTC